ncbi:hypothetical protein [Catenuloplanes japonicus]|uniref:hypothetical protein n=1 Tax=Catenuloplanes japonicus TaxID=33876 RepID=UPI0012FBEC69|nr:hypothetical protein [Catenuloplanes japonicus]
MKDQVRVGQWWCNTCGSTVTPRWNEVVPTCPACTAMPLEVVDGPQGVIYREPTPARCDTGHPLGPGTVLLGWTGCGCNPAHGHRSWACQAAGCGDVQMWPPHRPVDDAPYFGPGRDDAWRAG